MTMVATSGKANIDDTPGALLVSENPRRRLLVIKPTAAVWVGGDECATPGPTVGMRLQAGEPLVIPAPACEAAVYAFAAAADTEVEWCEWVDE